MPPGYSGDPRHKNGTLDTPSSSAGMIKFGSPNQATGSSFSPGTGTCSGLYCHGNFPGGLNAIPSWSGTVSCSTGKCHNDPQTFRAHGAHAVTESHPCSACHSGAGYGTSRHADGVSDVVFEPGAGLPWANPSGTWDSAAKSCGSLNCHGGGTPVWTSAASLACAGCHVAGSSHDPVVRDISSGENTVSNLHGPRSHKTWIASPAMPHTGHPRAT